MAKKKPPVYVNLPPPVEDPPIGEPAVDPAPEIEFGDIARQYRTDVHGVMSELKSYPKGEKRERRITVDGLNYEHVYDDPGGVWVYRVM